VWLLVCLSASRLERRMSTCEPLTVESCVQVTEHSNISGDDGTDRHFVKKTQCLSTTGRLSSTVIRKQFHVIAVAVFLPGLLSDINVLRVAVSCSLIVFILLEVGADNTTLFQ